MSMRHIKFYGSATVKHSALSSGRSIQPVRDLARFVTRSGWEIEGSIASQANTSGGFRRL